MELWQLRQRQRLPLEAKIQKTVLRIREFNEYMDGKVYISFSGGLDSTVLSEIARSEYSNMPAVFVNTGLEYPEIVSFVKTKKNVEQIRPAMSYPNVLKTYGYPVVSKIVARFIRDVQTRGGSTTRLL